MWFTVIDGFMRGLLALFGAAVVALGWVAIPPLPAVGVPILLLGAFIIAGAIRPSWHGRVIRAVGRVYFRLHDKVLVPYIGRPLENGADALERGATAVAEPVGAAAEWLFPRILKVLLLALAAMLLIGLAFLAFSVAAALPISAAIMLGAIIIALAVARRAA